MKHILSNPKLGCKKMGICAKVKSLFASLPNEGKYHYRQGCGGSRLSPQKDPKKGVCIIQYNMFWTSVDLLSLCDEFWRHDRPCPGRLGCREALERPHGHRQASGGWESWSMKLNLCFNPEPLGNLNHLWPSTFKKSDYPWVKVISILDARISKDTHLKVSWP